MIGKNTIIMNQATLREAVQYWIDNKVFVGTQINKVEAVEAHESYNGVLIVAVRLSGEEETKPC